MGQRGATNDAVQTLTRQISALRRLIKWHKDLGENTMIMFSQEAGVPFAPMDRLETQLKEMSERLKQLRAAQRN